MKEIKWSDEISVGVDLIDSQHKELIRIANELIKAVHLGQEKEILDKVINKLREYTVFHFNCEEDLMEEIRYPGRSDQVREHIRLKKDVKAFQRQLYLQEDITANTVLEFVTNWLIKHILAYDRKLARFIRQQKAKGIEIDAKESETETSNETEQSPPSEPDTSAKES